MTAAFNYATGQAFTEPLGRFQTVDSPFIDTDINSNIIRRVFTRRIAVEEIHKCMTNKGEREKRKVNRLKKKTKMKVVGEAKETKKKK